MEILVLAAFPAMQSNMKLNESAKRTAEDPSLSIYLTRRRIPVLAGSVVIEE
jgi:hypothetical protein